MIAHLTLPADAYGDPLPAGVVARLGSVHWQCAEAPDHLLWSPDGKHLIGTHRGTALTIWSYPAGKVVGKFTMPELPPEEHSRRAAFAPSTLTPQQIRFDPDGRSMLVYGRQNELYHVNLPDGSWRRIDRGALLGAGVALTANGRFGLIETADIEGGPRHSSELRLVDLSSPKRMQLLWSRQVIDHSGINRARTFLLLEADTPQITNDCRFVVASSIETGITTFVVIDRERKRTGVFDAGKVGSVWLAPDGSAFFATLENGDISRWRFNRDRASGPLAKVAIAEAVALEVKPDELVFSPDSRTIVAINRGEQLKDGSTERTITILDARTLRTTRSWTIRTGGPKALDRFDRVDPRPHGDLLNYQAAAIGPDNHTLAIASADSPRMRFFDVRTGEEVRTAGGHVNPVTTLRATSARRLISLSADGQLRSWDLTSVGRAGRLPSRSPRESDVLDDCKDDDVPPTLPTRAPATMKLLYDRGRNRIEGRMVDGESLVWEDIPLALAKVRFHANHVELPDATHRDGQCFAVGVGDTIQLRDCVSGEVVQSLGTPGLWPTAVEFISDTNLLAVGYEDGQILLWDLWPRELSRARPTAAEFDRLWGDLASDPRTADRARRRLLAYPDAAIAALRKNLRGLQQPTELEIDQWLARLSHPRFAVREEATLALIRHIDVTEAAVRELLASTTSPEAQQRLQTVLATIKRPGSAAPVVRLMRTIAILERIGTADARELLLRVGRGSGPTAERAIDALERLQQGVLALP
jgi:WD40 repeat protein